MLTKKSWTKSWKPSTPQRPDKDHKPMSQNNISDNILHAENFYFVGAGGIGMAALERFFLHLGKRVAGYDRSPSPLTEELQREGIEISFEDSMDAVPETFRNPADTVAVYTPAVPHDNISLSFYREGGFRLVKRAKVLGDVTRASKSLCFAGTHGKTTTSSMAAHILHEAGSGSNAFLGGVLRNYGTNLLLSAGSPYSVVEADEYDRSFHHLSPWIAVVTATDPDHLDIYGTPEAYLESFAHFTSLIRPDGYLLKHEGISLENRAPESVKSYTYGRDRGDFRAENITYSTGTLSFDFVYPGGRLDGISLGVPVDINIENAVAALAACWLTGDIDLPKAREAVASFQGAERRFQFHLKEDMPGGRVVIDDYAHHPDEVSRSIESVRRLYPDSRLTVAFQPHLYSRTRDFAPQFAKALDMADEVILVDLYPAREEPIPGISSKTILDLVTKSPKSLISKKEFVPLMSEKPFEVLLVMGAGDLSFEIPALTRNLTSR